MEVVDVYSHHIDKTQNLITVEFKVLGLEGCPLKGQAMRKNR
jgi:hypothetical protein